MRMSWDESKARKKYYLHHFYISNPKAWKRSGDHIICKCGHGYGSKLDGLCRKCRGIDARDGYAMIMEYLANIDSNCVNKDVIFSMY
jgi:hypothetical protein